MRNIIFSDGQEISNWKVDNYWVDYRFSKYFPLFIWREEDYNISDLHGRSECSKHEKHSDMIGQWQPKGTAKNRK